MYVVVKNGVVGQYYYSSTQITIAIAVVFKCVFESSFSHRKYQLSTNKYDDGLLLISYFFFHL